MASVCAPMLDPNQGFARSGPMLAIPGYVVRHARISPALAIVGDGYFGGPGEVDDSSNHDELRV